MFKVSFKDAPKNPSKVITKLGNKTTVILKGTCKLPEFWKNLPEEILKWVGSQKHIEAYEDVSSNTMIIFAEGTSKCHPEDKYDTILGERVAESRAKQFIYKFFCDLCCKIYNYYSKIMFGSHIVVEDGSGDSLDQCISKYEGLYSHERNHYVELLQSKNNGEQ